MSRLPEDVLAVVFRHVASETPQCLRSAALVCRAWRTPAQRLLFASVSLQTRKHAAMFSRTCLSRTAGTVPLGFHVRALQVSLRANRGLDTAGDTHSISGCRRTGSSSNLSAVAAKRSSKDITWVDLEILLACCPRLRQLGVSNITAQDVIPETFRLPQSLRALSVSGDASPKLLSMLCRELQARSGSLTALALDLVPDASSMGNIMNTARNLVQSVLTHTKGLQSLAMTNSAWYTEYLSHTLPFAPTLRDLATDTWSPQSADLVSSGLPNLATFELSGCRGGFRTHASKSLLSLLPDGLVELRLALDPWTLTLSGRDALEAQAVEDVGVPSSLRKITWTGNSYVQIPTSFEEALKDTCFAHALIWSVEPFTPLRERILLPTAKDIDGEVDAQSLDMPVVQPIVLPKNGPVKTVARWASRARHSVFVRLAPWDY